MKIYELMFYLFVGGLLLGHTQNSLLEECGEASEIDTEEVLSVALWPIVIGVALIADDDAIRKTECNNVTKVRNENKF